MKHLDTILNNQELDETLRKQLVDAANVYEQKMQENNIAFTDDSAEMIFTNHLMALTKRIISKEFIPDIDEELMSEVSEEAFGISESIVKEVFTAYGCEINKSEVFLVATHIQIYLDTRQ